MLRPIHNQDYGVPTASLCAPTRTERLAACGRNASCGVRVLPMYRASREAGANERRQTSSSHPSSLFTLYVGGSADSPHHTERGSSLLTAKVFQAFRASVCSAGSGSNIPTQGSPLRTVHRLSTVRVIRHEGSLPYFAQPAGFGCGESGTHDDADVCGGHSRRFGTACSLDCEDAFEVGHSAVRTSFWKLPSGPAV